MLSHTFHFENNCPWGICSCAVCVVLDKVPSRGHSFAWHSLLGVGVSRHVGIARYSTLLNVPHYTHFVSFCGRTIIVPLYARWIDESCWIMDETVIVCIHLWGLNLGVDCMFPTFSNISNQFHLFSVQLHSFSAQFHSCSVRVYPFSSSMTGSYFLPFSNSFVGDFLPKCAKRNFEAESVRVRADLSFCSCPPKFWPSPSHHPNVWIGKAFNLNGMDVGVTEFET